jgi:hypothetical protein
MEENLQAQDSESTLSLYEWVKSAPLLLPFRGRIPLSFFFPNGSPLEQSEFFQRFQAHFLELRKNQRRLWRLGLEFEDAIHALLKSHPKISHVERGIECFPTGELDFLITLEDEPQFRLHIETAVKYYLCLDHGGSKDANRFVGASLQDSLGKKISKLENEQLRRFQDQPQLRSLIPLDEDTIVESTPWVNGMLFYSWIPEDGSLSALGDELVFPKEVSPQHAKGFWFRTKDSEHFRDRHPAPEWEIFPLFAKQSWIRTTAACERPESRLEFREISPPSEQPQCFLICGPQGARFRVFRVEDSWACSTAEK